MTTRVSQRHFLWWVGPWRRAFPVPRRSILRVSLLSERRVAHPTGFDICSPKAAPTMRALSCQERYLDLWRRSVVHPVRTSERTERDSVFNFFASSRCHLAVGTKYSTTDVQGGRWERRQQKLVNRKSPYSGRPCGLPRSLGSSFTDAFKPRWSPETSGIAPGKPPITNTPFSFILVSVDDLCTGVWPIGSHASARARTHARTHTHTHTHAHKAIVGNDVSRN